MPVPSPGTYDVASQLSLLAVKAKTDLIPADIAAQLDTNIPAVKAKTDLIPADIATQLDTNIPAVKARVDMLNAYIHLPLYPMRGAVVAGTWVYLLYATIAAYNRDLMGTVVVPGCMYNTSNVLNDEYKYPKVALPAGNYSLEVYYYQYTSHGILTVRHGATLLGTIDMYGATAPNQIGTINFNIVADTIADIRYIVESKNAASSGYILHVQSAVLWRRS